MSVRLPKRGSIYYFRRVVPEELRPYFRTASGAPRTEFMESLGTKDLARAKELHRLRGVEVDVLFREARDKLLAGIEPGRDASRRAEAEAREWAEHQASMWVDPEVLREEFEYDAREATRRSTIKRLRGADLSPEDRALRDLIPDHEFLDESEKDRIERQRYSEAMEAANAHVAVLLAPKQPSYPRLIDVFDAYAGERELSAATLKRWRPLLQAFADFVGHDDVSRFTQGEVVAWKDSLINETDAKGRRVRGTKTIKEAHLAALSATLSFAVSNAVVAVNVAEAVSVRVAKKQKLRDPSFTDAEAVAILRGTFAEPSRSLASHHKAARRWIPWLCAYSGARVGEMSQLRKEDVQARGGVWVMRITPEAGSVKNHAARLVPLHPHIIEQGFLKFVDGQADGPLFYDPSRGRKGSSGNPHHKKVGERLAAWVRGLGVNDPGVQPNHGWRHRFKTEARRVNMDPEARDVLAGHAPSTEGQKYGSFPIEALAREIEKLARIEVGPL